jgi:hypothetical protein
MSISVRRVRKTRYQSTSWEHDDVPITDLSSSSLHQDCPDGACVSSPTAEPSGMAINEKGLPGEKGTKPAAVKK